MLRTALSELHWCPSFGCPWRPFLLQADTGRFARFFFSQLARFSSWKSKIICKVKYNEDIVY